MLGTEGEKRTRKDLYCQKQKVKNRLGKTCIVRNSRYNLKSKNSELQVQTANTLAINTICCKLMYLAYGIPQNTDAKRLILREGLLDIYNKQNQTFNLKTFS
ncbi:hypothetical protein MsAg5_05480 [Methanosarcinaceae archaeon Ag5]|uniref:Uncharacterized protein n=1 Tax=Methanolapillus africanus TaxID=3028297 RepID=A0AAE4MJC8_9EURY|nr:hypothetical protein [Methanosarcinaceae archaeon Ag5]